MRKALYMYFRLYTFALLCSCLSACDPAYPPVVANGYTDAIEISVSFAGGSPPVTGVRLAPRTELVQRRRGLEISQIDVKEPSGKLRVYRETDLADARAGQKVGVEVWILSEGGLKLGDEQDLRKLKTGKR